MKHAAWGILALLIVVPAWTPAVDLLPGQPFTAEIPVSIPGAVLAASGTPFTVPAGKLLIIEFVTVNLQGEVGAANNASATLHTSLGGSPHDHSILMTKQGQFFTDLFVASQPLRIYAQGGSQVNCTLGRNFIISLPASGVVTVTGRLIND